MMTESTPTQNTPSTQTPSQETEMLKQENLSQELPSQEPQALNQKSASQETLSEQASQDKKKSFSLGRWLFVLLIAYPILVVIGIMPMGFPIVWLKGFSGASWKEEVQLHDGSVVLVKRNIIGKGKVHLNEIEFFQLREEQLEVLDTNGKALTPKFIIRWKTLLLDKTEDGKWFTVVGQYGYGWSSCAVYKQYVLENNDWKQVKFDKRLIGRLSNLTWGYLDELNNMPKFIKLSDKPFGDSNSMTAGGGRYYKITIPIRTYCNYDYF